LLRWKVRWFCVVACLYSYFYVLLFSFCSGCLCPAPLVEALSCFFKWPLGGFRVAFTRFLLCAVALPGAT